MKRKKANRAYDYVLILLFCIILYFIASSMYNRNKLISKELEITELKSDVLTLDQNTAIEYEEHIITKIGNTKLEIQIKLMQLDIDILNEDIERYKTEKAALIEFERDYYISNYDITTEEMEILYRIVEAEATGYGFEEKLNVACVILNRVKSDYFTNSIKSVVFQDRQFSPIDDGRYWEVAITNSTIEAVNKALRTDYNAMGALYFMNKAASDKSNVSWFERELTYLFTDGSGHSFWR